jgi:integrase
MARPKKQIVTTGKRGNGRGSITKYKGNRYRWRLRNADGKVLESGITETKEQAENEYAKAKADTLRNLKGSTEQTTLAEYAETWLASRDTRESTRVSYRHELGLILPELGKKRLKDIEPTDIKRALQKLSGTKTRDRISKTGKVIKGKILASRTIAHTRARLKSLFQEAVHDRIIYVSPAASVRPSRQVRTENPHFALDFPEVARMLEIASALHQSGHCRLWAAVSVAVSVGLRNSELMALRWKDVDLENDVLRIRHTVTKQGKQLVYAEQTKTIESRRDIPIPPNLKAVLQLHQKRQLEEKATAEGAWVNTGAVFATKTGTWIHPDNFRRTLRELTAWSNWDYYSSHAEKDSKKIARGHRVFRASERQSIEALIREGEPLPKITPHDLRHTAGTLMLRRGMKVEAVSKILGHSSITQTYDVYRHLLESELKSVMVDLLPSPLATKPVVYSPLN